MTMTTLLFSASLALVSAVLFAYIARTILRRRISGEANLANALYGVWWAALALSTLTTAVTQGLGAVGAATLVRVHTLTLVNLSAITVALWGLLYYLLYLYSGRRGILWPLTAGYVAYYVYLLYFVVAADPVGVRVERWSVGLDFANSVPAPVGTAVFLLLLGPQIVAALALLRAAHFAEDPLQRRRTQIVSVGILIWFGSALVASVAGLSDVEGWQVASRLISLLVATAMLLAYAPPRWLEVRLAASKGARVRGRRGEP